MTSDLTRPYPDPMCLRCDGTGFLPPEEPEDKFPEVEFCRCWAAQKFPLYKKRSH
jgi:hypothetical protein